MAPGLPTLKTFVISFAIVATIGCLQGRRSHAEVVSPGKDVLDDQASVKLGETTFVQNCAYCHGSQGSGGKAKPLQCRPKLTPDYVFETISEGRQSGSMVMPPWKDSLDEKTRWQLTAYIMSLKAVPACATAN